MSVPATNVQPKIDSIDASMNSGPARCDQKQCPRCGNFGCPATRGSRKRTEGRIRYRECGRCGWVFQTMQKHGSAVEEIVQ